LMSAFIKMACEKIGCGYVKGTIKLLPLWYLFWQS
jgi:hypothetical protein